MNKKLIKTKLLAAAVHGLISIFVIFLLVVLALGIWFPGSFRQMLQGDALFFLIVVVDICLGALISVVIYNPSKSTKELILDYSIIAVLQISALVYGIYTVAQSRPVYIVFVKDRLEITVAAEFDEKRLSEGRLLKYSNLPLRGPLYVCSNRPSSPSEVTDLLFSGYDVQVLPKYFRDCRTNELAEEGYPLSRLHTIIENKKKQSNEFAEALASVQHKIDSLSEGDVVWLPATHRFGAWIVIINKTDNSIVEYININPFG